MKCTIGMTLYETLAPIYYSLFPVDPRAPAFLNSLILGRDRPSGPRVLALSALGWTAVGIDLEAVKIALASAAASDAA